MKRLSMILMKERSDEVVSYTVLEDDENVMRFIFTWNEIY